MKRRGSTLLLSLLVLATVMIIAVSIAEVARTEILVGRSTDYTNIATYAAESALEEGAYQIRKNPAATIAGLNGSSLTLANGASYTRTADNKTGQLSVVRLPKDSSVGFDLYDPETGLAAGKESIKITIDACSGAEVLELGFTEWDPGTGNFSANFQKFRYTCPLGTNYVILNNSIAAARTYRFYVRSLTAPLGSFRVVACSADNGGGSCDMPGRVYFAVTGSYRGSNRILSLEMPRLPSVSGIFGYTIFSECQIIKDPNNPAPSC